MNSNWFISELLECGTLDVEYLERVFETCNVNYIEIDVQEVLSSYGSMHINNFISECCYKLAEWFLKTHQSQIEELLNISDFERYREENYDEIYEIYVNYLDSHIWFKNDKIQSLYENSSFYIA